MYNRVYINYDSIPEPTRKRLPPRAALIEMWEQEKKQTRQQEFFKELTEAMESKSVARWSNEIRTINDRLTPELVNKFAQKAAVFERIAQVYHGAKGDLKALYKAYLQIYPDGYTSPTRLCMAIKQAEKEGVLSIAVNLQHLAARPKKFGEEHEFYAVFALSHNKGYCITKAYEMFTEACLNAGIEVPAYKWFRTFNTKNANLINENRMGKTEWNKRNQNYAKIIPALFAGDQWQMDGWRIPIYCKKRNDKGNLEYFVTYNLFAVLDAHSRKILGFDVAESESTESILNGIERAVKNTLNAPYEIVADNHSFNKTSEAGNLKEEFEKLGVHWVVDSNPRRKAILESAFRTLGDEHFKHQYGYIGQGVKTKMENGITQQELRDIYTKPDNFPTYEQIVAITTYVVAQYNDTKIKKLGDTPNKIYERSEKPNAAPVDDFKRTALFVRASEHKVSHGQITIQRAGHKHEYQLPAEYSAEWNNKTVSVRYSNFDEIFLYDPATGNPICIVEKKFAIHGALANQTEKDRELLFKNKGRMEGIETRGRKRKEKLFDDAMAINPDAYEHINKLTASKDALDEIRRNAALKNTLTNEFNINIDNVSDLPKINEMLDVSLKPRKEEVNRHPFDAGEGSMEKIKLTY